MAAKYSQKCLNVLESINGVKEGRWKATLSFYKLMLRDFLNSFLREEPKGGRDFGVQFYPANFSVRLKKGTVSAINNMPIKWVLHWQPNAGTTINTQILREVSQCVGSFNGVKEGAWKATLSFYQPILKDKENASEFPQDFLGVSLQEQPNKHYMVIKGQRLIMEAESSIQMIMENLQSYKTKGALNFEGFQYQLGDFWLRVGKVVPMNSDNLRGIVMEMEYRPISSWETSQLIMGEFFDMWQEALGKRSLPGHFVHIEPNFSEYGLSDQYTSQHTAIQYASIVAQLIATGQSSEAVRN